MRTVRPPSLHGLADALRLPAQSTDRSPSLTAQLVSRNCSTAHRTRITLSALDIQKLKERIEALDDEALIAETLHLRASTVGIAPKLADKWDEMIAEAIGQIENKLTIGRKKEARGRLRSFCLERRKRDCRG